MDSVTWHEEVSLHDAVAIIAFEGWNDGGESATMAVDHLESTLGAVPIASIDHEEYADFQVTRPSLVVDDDGERVIEWPATVFSLGSVGTQMVVTVRGDEPRLRWRSFAAEVISVLEALDVRRVVLLGAFVGQVAHTMPVPVIGLGSADLMQTHDVVPSNYEGPTGMVGVLTSMLTAHDFETTSLWAAVPHYLAVGENPKAAHALVRTAGTVLGLDLEADALRPFIEAWIGDVESAMTDNEELRGYVETLEASTSDIVEAGGEQLVEEIEQFLREGD